MTCFLEVNLATCNQQKATPKLQNQVLANWKMRFVLAALLSFAALSFVLVTSEKDSRAASTNRIFQFART
jgi:hypothetical protein